MATHIKLSLDTRRKNSSTFPIVYRLTHNRKPTSISTGIRVKKSEWDHRNHKIRSSYKGTDSPTRLNNMMVKKIAKMVDEITRLEDKGTLKFMSLAQLREVITKSTKKSSFYGYTQELIDNMLTANRVGNARVYRDTLNAVKNFTGNKDFPFEELNLNFLQRFETWHLSKGNKLGGLSVYLRTIRAINRKAIKSGQVEEEGYAFKKYIIRNGKPRKRAITFDLIQKFKSLELDKESSLFRDQQIFLMSIYLSGMPYVDMCHLKLSNIIDGRIKYDRQKTNEPYDLKIDDQLAPILDYFIKGKKENDFILPVIKRADTISQYKDILWARTRYNKNLKRIATLAGIEENLSSYVSRHSFASGADEMGIPITAISQMLGHQRISTTQAYLDNLRTSKKDEYQDEVLKNF